MNFLADTSVIAEWAQARPNAGVVRWLAEVDEDRVFISVVTIAEMRCGVERMRAGARRDRIAAWLAEDLVERFEGRILPVDVEVALEFGVLAADVRRFTLMKQIGMKLFVAATARCLGMAVVTCRRAGYLGLGVEVVEI